MYNWTTEWPGIYARHDSNCPLRNGGECTCARVTYRASAKAPDEHSRLLSPDFGDAVEARDWLRDQRDRLTAALAVADDGPAVGTVIEDFLAAAERGDARERSGAEYSRTRLSQIRAGLAYVDSEMGKSPLQAVRRRNIQSFIDQLHTAGLSSERIIEVVSTLRELFVYAIQRDIVDFNPIVQLRLPAGSVPAPEPVPVAAAAHNGSGNGQVNGYVNGHENVLRTTAPFAVTPQPMQAVNGQAHHLFDHEAARAFHQEPQRPFDAHAQQSFPSEPQRPVDPYEDPDRSINGEPIYGPGMSAHNEPPPPPPPRPEPPREASSWAPPYPPPPPPPAYQSGEGSWAPVLGPPMGTPLTPPSAATPGYPYDTAPMFAPPATRMVTPIGAETHYGTPTYGTESIPTQPTVQAPAQNPTDGVFMSEQMFWWITRIVVIVFVLIALVLAAESI